MVIRCQVKGQRQTKIDLISRVDFVADQLNQDLCLIFLVYKPRELHEMNSSSTLSFNVLFRLKTSGPSFLPFLNNGI